MTPAVEKIVLKTAHAALCESPGIAQWTPGMIEDHRQLPPERRADLARHAAYLRQELTGHLTVTLDPRLFEVVCFAPSWSSPLRMGRRSASAALDLLDSGVRSDSKKRAMANWIAWAHKMIATFRLLPAVIRSGIPVAAEDDLEKLRTLSEFVNANPLHSARVAIAIQSLHVDEARELVEVAVSLLEQSAVMFSIAESILAPAA